MELVPGDVFAWERRNPSASLFIIPVGRSQQFVGFHLAGEKRAWEFQAPDMQEERSATVLPQGLHEHTVRQNLVAATDDAEITVVDDVDAGSRSPVKVAAPTQPTDKEIEHELTHLPFRNWCKE